MKLRDQKGEYATISDHILSTIKSSKSDSRAPLHHTPPPSLPRPLRTPLHAYRKRDYITQTPFEIYENTSGRIPLTCASDHFLTH